MLPISSFVRRVCFLAALLLETSITNGLSIGVGTFALRTTSRLTARDAVVPAAKSSKCNDEELRTDTPKADQFGLSRRTAASVALGVAAASVFSPTSPASAKCTDIETCREIGDQKVMEDMKSDPTFTLQSGVRYKVLRPPSDKDQGSKVTEGSTVDLIYSISEGSGAYMYSKGFGFEKVDFGGKKQSDLGLDSLKVVIGRKDVPVGIEEVLIGMKRGERRRVKLPAAVGFETSDWKPEPTTRRGVLSLARYKQILEGFGSQPPFPASTIWDVEVLGIRK